MAGPKRCVSIIKEPGSTVVPSMCEPAMALIVLEQLFCDDLAV